MLIKIWTKYNVGYLPTSRCRKLRYKEEEEYMNVEVKEASMSQLTPAFEAESVMIYAYAGKLWRQSTERDIHVGNPENPMTALEALVYAGTKYSTYFGRYKDIFDEGTREQREDIVARAEKDIAGYLIVDGVLYKEASEPMYCIYTFGLGANHASTDLCVVNFYNSNISKERYFNALDYNKAVEKAIKIATRRGDTKSIDRIKNFTAIKVYDEKYVTRNPEKDHGNGNDFLNSIEAVVESSKNANEAALLTMVTMVSNKEK